MSSSYDDVIGHVHHVSKTRPPMPMRDRAAQFSPFAALTGYGEAVSETARLTEARQEPDEQELALLDRQLALLAAQAADHPMVSLEYFLPDERKSGGRRVTVTGTVAKISPAAQTLTFQDGTTVKFADILSLDGPLFAEL